MAGSGIEIIRGQLEQLKAQREQIYNEQLLPLDDAIGHLEKLVNSQPERSQNDNSQNGKNQSGRNQSGKVQAVTTEAPPTEAPAPIATVDKGAVDKGAVDKGAVDKGAVQSGKAAKSRSQSKSAPARNTKAPTKSKAPTNSKAPSKSQAPAQAVTPVAKAATVTPAKPSAEKNGASKSALRLKATYRDKRVDEAIAELLDADPTKTWKSEEVVNAISAPASKSELATYLRSIRLSLSLGADKKKWQKVASGPAAYASNHYKAAV